MINCGNDLHGTRFGCVKLRHRGDYQRHELPGPVTYFTREERVRAGELPARNYSVRSRRDEKDRIFDEPIDFAQLRRGFARRDGTITRTLVYDVLQSNAGIVSGMKAHADCNF